MLSGKLNKTAQNTSTRNAYQAAKTVSVCISRRVTIRINTLLRLCCWDYVHTKWFQTHPLRLRSGMIGEVCITKTLSSDYANFFLSTFTNIFDEKQLCNWPFSVSHAQHSPNSCGINSCAWNGWALNHALFNNSSHFVQ